MNGNDLASYFARQFMIFIGCAVAFGFAVCAILLYLMKHFRIAFHWINP